MNKKQSIFILLLIFFSSAATFAAQEVDMEQYRSIIAAYNQGAGYFKGLADDTYPTVIQKHKEKLEERKKAIESSYMPLLINFIASILAASSFGMGYYAFQGASAAQDLFKQLPRAEIFGDVYRAG